MVHGSKRVRSLVLATLVVVIGASTIATTSAAPSQAAAGALGAAVWTEQPTKSTGQLAAVSCVSERFCVSVGRSTVSLTAFKALIEMWDGTSWKSAPVPAVSAILFGVSCVDATWCMAVGDSQQQYGPTVAMKWDGATWTNVAMAKTTSSYATLRGISCANRSMCIAVGYENGEQSTLQTYGQMWNGTSWSISATVKQASSTTELSGVSCATPTMCVAVGSYSKMCCRTELIEMWNGVEWEVVSTRPPGVSSILRGVSCPRVNACVAVGTGQTLDNVGVAVIDTWDGVRWSRVPAQQDFYAYSELWSVSCAGPNRCAAVGFTASWPKFYEQTLAMSTEGGAWTTQTTSNPGSLAILFGVSCLRSGRCVAAGQTYPQYTIGEELILVNR